MNGAAIFSPCGTWRFRLTREWDTSAPPAVIIGANPSTATGEEDDATIRLETSILKRWGFGSYVKLNAYAFKATLRDVPYAIAIAAWGAIPKLPCVNMILAVARLAGVDLHAFGINPSGTPWHPLYKPIAARPVLWKGAAS
jgi:hypothetical protein